MQTQENADRQRQLEEGTRQFTTLLAATGRSAMDTDDAGKE